MVSDIKNWRRLFLETTKPPGEDACHGKHGKHGSLKETATTATATDFATEITENTKDGNGGKFVTATAKADKNQGHKGRRTATDFATEGTESTEMLRPRRR